MEKVSQLENLLDKEKLSKIESGIQKSLTNIAGDLNKVVQKIQMIKQENNKTVQIAVEGEKEVLGILNNLSFLKKHRRLQQNDPEFSPKNGRYWDDCFSYKRYCKPNKFIGT